MVTPAPGPAPFEGAEHFDFMCIAIVDVLGVARDRITPEARISDDLGADILDELEIALRVEDEFGIEMPDADTTEAATVGGWCALIARRRAAAGKA